MLINRSRYLIRVLLLSAIIDGSFAMAELKGQAVDPLGLMLTWQQDPTSTMTIDWHAQNDLPASLEYRGSGSQWVRVQGEQHQFPYSDRVINRVEITGLKAGSVYQFRLDGYERSRKFRTLPDHSFEPIRFVTGGDVRHSVEMMEQTNRRAASYNPEFILWGGDLAYADGREDQVTRWHEFMDITMNTLITDDGRMIPVIASIGNHEVKGGRYRNNSHENRANLPPYQQNDESRAQIAPYYYSLFAFPGQPGYGVLDISDYMSIIVLDTDHANPVEGEQTRWLEKILAEREGVAHIFPVYHNPAYPSVRSYKDGISVKLRETWLPLFEKAGVKVAFENHDHAYKRTYPMLGGRIHPNGIVFIGDGAWGVGTRPIGGGNDPDYWTYHGDDPWYLKRAASERHFIIATIHGPHQHFLVVNEEGEIIDEYPSTTHTERERVRLAEPWGIPPQNEVPSTNISVVN